MRPPDSVYLCAEALDAEVVQVASIGEIEGDPDLPDVCGIVLVSHRDPAEWPATFRRARHLAPKRPVVVLSLFGQEPPPGARRTLGSSLLQASDPPERLLLALDPDLR